MSPYRRNRVCVMIADRVARSVRTVVLRVGVSGILLWSLEAPSAMAAGWSVQRAVSPANTQDSDFFGVSCASKTACTAVGDYANRFGGGEPLAERWNGAHWSIKRSPTRPARGFLGGLEAVSCITAAACTATGSVGGLTLAERWDGTSWTIQRTPNPADGSDLSGVACAAPTACIAVGWFVNGVTLAEQWNGISWTIDPTPTPPGATLSAMDALTDVSCASPADCTAVGEYTYLARTNVPLAEHWNGVNWSIEQTPQAAGAKNTEFLGISCASTTLCIAVGDTTLGDRGAVTLSERWNGVSWTVQPTPDLGRGRNSHLFGVSCPTTTVCTAVGNYTSRDGTTTPLAERWNGTSWTIQRTPHAAVGKYSGLLRVSCATTKVCTAVGSESNRAGTIPLVERYS